jgi:hypothetical protein
MRRQTRSRLFFFERGEAGLIRHRQRELAPQVQHRLDVARAGELVEADILDAQLAGRGSRGADVGACEARALRMSRACRQASAVRGVARGGSRQGEG